MEKLTKTGLIDKCIDGDEKKLGLLFGKMFDPFSCLFSILQHSSLTAMPTAIVFTDMDGVADFDIEEDVDVTPAQKDTSEKVFNCNVIVQKNNKTTNIKVNAG